MPEVQIEIGGRSFDVACQEGEEHYLQAAAKMLDEEASVLSAQIGRIPEARMLLMAGLMLVDKTAGYQDKLREAEDRMAEKEAEYAEKFATPFEAAQRGFIDEVIMPKDTRRKLIKAFSALETKQVLRPNRKHGNIPL